MKPEARIVDVVSAAMRSRRDELGLRNADIGRDCAVDPSQVSRILSGNFRTLSHNVMQICTILGVEIASEPIDVPEPDANQRAAEDGSRARLQAEILKIWDRTPADAERLVAFLKQLATLRSAGVGRRL